MTRRLLPLALPLLLAGLLVACPSPATGCAVAPPPGGDITISSESALVIYDPAAKTEHFIRTASFQSTSAEFGFMVPTPTKPELAEASAEVFGELADITRRRTVVQKRAKALNFACGLLPLTSSKFAAGEAALSDHAKNSVRVVEQKRVGDYDAAVLQAAEPKSLRDWLTANGYDARPALDPWFEAYTTGKSYITAFKIAADSPAAGGNVLALTSQAVRISFPTDRPFYPYREPADMQTVTGPRQLKLFVLSDERVTGTIGGGVWAARTEWSNKVPAERVAAVADKGKLPANVGTREWHLTEFVDHSSPRPGTDELYLNRSEDQSAVERPPLVVWEEYDPWPWLFGSIAVLVGGAFAFGVWRVLKAKPTG